MLSLIMMWKYLAGFQTKIYITPTEIAQTKLQYEHTFHHEL